MGQRCAGRKRQSLLLSAGQSVFGSWHFVVPRNPLIDLLGKKCHSDLVNTRKETLSNFAEALGASKSASTLLVLFIPSKDRSGAAIKQLYWVRESLKVLGTLFGGATAFPKGQGIWRDDAQGGKLLIDQPVVIQCYTSEETLLEKSEPLRVFLHRLGREAKQGAIGLVIDRDYLEIAFPLEEILPKPKSKNKR
jgi:hypothetical protein